jgi:hypothetical protein
VGTCAMEVAYYVSHVKSMKLFVIQDFTVSVGIGKSKGNRWKDYDSECDTEDYNCDDADAALRKDMVLCRELRVTNHRGIQSYSGVDGTLREKLNDTIFG